MKIVELNPFSQKAEVKKLIERCAQPNTVGFFHSWPWVETWLNTLPTDLALRFLWCEQGADSFGAFIGERVINNFGIRRTKRYVNETGLRDYDVLVQEFNQLYCINAPQTDDYIKRLQLLQGAADELVVRLTGSENISASSNVKPTHTVPYYAVSLEQLRSERQHYTASLSASTRKKVVQTQNAYRSKGQLHVEVADSTAKALQYFNEMSKLSIQRWATSGTKSAFEYQYFNNFHRTLIEKQFIHGRISMLKVTAGKMVIGYLYNFIDDKNVLFYQCGFVPGENNRFRSGYLCHSLAIEYYATCSGLNTYHFLAGAQSYKRELGSHIGTLTTYTNAKPSMKLHLVKLAKKLKGVA